MRVIAGTAGGRRLASPPGRDTRPTSDRVREALFSSVAAIVPGARVLDLYAGSGALAIEALSRGAEHAVLVERDARTVALIRRNLEVTGTQDRATVVHAGAQRFCATPSGGPFDLVLVDPPYAEALQTVFARLAELEVVRALAGDVVVVIERSRRDPDLDAPPPGFLASERRRSYGDTVLLYFARVDAGRAPAPTAEETVE